MKLILFEQGKDIEKGDVFIAAVDSTEGRRRVTLTLQDKPNVEWEKLQQ